MARWTAIPLALMLLVAVVFPSAALAKEKQKERPAGAVNFTAQAAIQQTNPGNPMLVFCPQTGGPGMRNIGQVFTGTVDTSNWAPLRGAAAAINQNSQLCFVGGPDADGNIPFAGLSWGTVEITATRGGSFTASYLATLTGTFNPSTYQVVATDQGTWSHGDGEDSLSAMKDEGTLSAVATGIVGFESGIATISGTLSRADR